MTDQERNAFEACREQAPIDIWHAAIAYLRSQGEPMFWVRLTSDGGYEGPIHNNGIERVRKLSGAWHPLYLSPQPAIPDGYRLVPVEPTEEMIDKVIDARMDALCAGKDHNMLDIYRDMLAAAPEPSK